MLDIQDKIKVAEAKSWKEFSNAVRKAEDEAILEMFNDKADYVPYESKGRIKCPVCSKDAPSVGLCPHCRCYTDCRTGGVEGHYTNTVPSKPPEVDMDKMINEFIQSFTGIPVKVDVALEGKSYYIAVSPELLHELEEGKVLA